MPLNKVTKPNQTPTNNNNQNNDNNDTYMGNQLIYILKNQR